jgi:hypothetical protein
VWIRRRELRSLGSTVGELRRRGSTARNSVGLDLQPEGERRRGSTVGELGRPRSAVGGREEAWIRRRGMVLATLCLQWRAAVKRERARHRRDGWRGKVEAPRVESRRPVVAVECGEE